MKVFPIKATRSLSTKMGSFAKSDEATKMEKIKAKVLLVWIMLRM